MPVSDSNRSTGIDYLKHHAHFELAMAHLMRQDVEECRAAMLRARRYLEQHPSVWHSAVMSRMESFQLLALAQFADARKKAETTHTPRSRCSVT